MAKNIYQNDDDHGATYATYANAERAIAKLANLHNNDALRYVIVGTRHGRYFPVFIGMDAVQCGVHFNFCVAA